MNNPFKKIYLTILLLPLCGCASILAEKKTSIERETRISNLPIEEKEALLSLNKSKSGAGYFDLLHVVEVNGYKIGFNPKNPSDILVIRNGWVLADISEGGGVVTIFKKMYQAPGMGSEGAVFKEDYIYYSGVDMSFEDYGLDGADVEYNNKHPNLSKSFVKGEVCKTITARVACCLGDDGRFGKGYRFTPENGWQIFSNRILTERCRAIDEN